MTAIIAVASGCSEEPPGAFVVVDSLGVKVVDIDWESTSLPRHLSEVPTWVVGSSASSGYAFPLYEVEDAKELDDGRVAIAEKSTQEVIWIDFGNREVTRRGGPGDGPAEFHELANLLPEPHGGVSAFDRARNRILEFDAEGNLVGETSVGAVSTPGTRKTLVRSRSGTRFLANVPGAPLRWVEGWSRSEAPVVRIDPTVDTLVTVRGSESVQLSEPVLATGVLWFGTTTLVSGGTNGIWIGDTADPQLEEWSEDGVLLTRVRWRSLRHERPSQEIRRELMDRHLEDVSSDGPVAVDLWRAIFSAIPESASVPRFHRILIGPVGDVWIGRRASPQLPLFGDSEASYEWLVYDTSTDEVTRVNTPEGFRPTHVRNGHLLGIHTDSMGVETVRRYDWVSPTE